MAKNSVRGLDVIFFNIVFASTGNQLYNNPNVPYMSIHSHPNNYEIYGNCSRKVSFLLGAPLILPENKSSDWTALTDFAPWQT